MKKAISLILIILFILGAFFAYDKHFKYILPDECKKEIATLLEQEIPKSTQEIDGLCEKIENEKDLSSKEIIESSIDTIKFNLYFKLIDVIQKCKNIEKEIPATDFETDLAIAIFPYLKKNKVGLASIREFLNYADKKQLEIKRKYR